MDFRRIEYIFLVTFFFLNIFLLFSFLDKNYNGFNGTGGAQRVDLVSEMQNNNITLPDFSQEENKIPYVQADSNSLLRDNVSGLPNQTGVIEEDGLVYNSILSNPIQIEGEMELTTEDIESLNSFVRSNQVLFGDQYQLFRYMPSTQQIIYVQLANNIPIIDGTSEIVFHLDSNRQVYSYRQTYAGPVSVQGASRDIINDQEAVETLYLNNEIQPSTTVGDPVLTYYRTLNLEDLSMYAPVWYIEVTTSTDTQVKRVDAISGSVIRSSTSDLPPDAEEEEQAEEETEEETPETESSGILDN